MILLLIWWRSGRVNGYRPKGLGCVFFKEVARLFVRWLWASFFHGQLIAEMILTDYPGIACASRAKKTAVTTRREACEKGFFEQKAAKVCEIKKEGLDIHIEIS